MSEQDGAQVTPMQRPHTTDPRAWIAYWKAQGQPWRTEPEIDVERQKYLFERRRITPNIEQGIYPFKDVKLNRADVEWLLATHENKLGLVDWGDKNQRERKGLDLRGADLSQENLSDLPLARIFCWITLREWERIEKDPSRILPVLMRDVNLYNTHLEGADLTGAHLEGAILYGAQLDGVNLNRATLSYEKYESALLADVRWGEINLAVVDWKPVKMLGDEQLAHLKLTTNGKEQYRFSRIEEYQRAVRANRQLATALRDQGLNEVADRFAYRAQMLHRKALLMQARWGQVKLLIASRPPPFMTYSLSSDGICGAKRFSHITHGS